jgi:hypothetical protein
VFKHQEHQDTKDTNDTNDTKETKETKEIKAQQDAKTERSLSARQQQALENGGPRSEYYAR